MPIAPLLSHVHHRIDHLEKPMVRFLAQFCAIATVNPPGDRYEECAAFLDRKLTQLGLTTRIVRVPLAQRLRLVPGSDNYPRPSVIARWDVGAPRTLLLTGHYDVVPATAGWKTDPFKPTLRAGKLIARGVSDMKGPDTAAIFAVQAMMQAGFIPPWNIELAFTPDEETGGYAGLGYLAQNRHLHADAAILLEGGAGRDIGYAHRGVLWIRITVLGKAAHASNPSNGINALEKAITLIGQLKTLQRAYARRPSALLTNSPVARRPTLMIGGISGGGSKINTIPDRFSFTIDRRLLPEDRLPQVKAEIMTIIRQAQKRDRQLKVQVEYPLHVPPGWTDQRQMICQVARKAVKAVLNKTPRFRMTGGFTDMHFLTHDAGIPTIGYGASGGGGIHADGEYLQITGLLQTAKTYTEIIRRLPTDPA
ncbi:MAG: ArgE/DapE family deacylase [Phycisphaeraceae bacterium]